MMFLHDLFVTVIVFLVLFGVPTGILLAHHLLTYPKTVPVDRGSAGGDFDGDRLSYKDGN